MKHEQFIKEVRDIVAAYVTDQAIRERLLAAKLVYGIGDGTYRGICYYGAWKNGEPKPTDLVEVAASGEESPVQLAGTTVHELGHVIAGSGTGHGPAWMKSCEGLGLRKIKAAGTVYTLAHFVPEIRAKIASLSNTDGTPVFGASRRGFLGLPAMKLRPCPLGVGTRGGTSRGTGSGSRLRKFICECEKPVIARVAADEFNASCNVCESAFKRAPEKNEKKPAASATPAPTQVATTPADAREFHLVAEVTSSEPALVLYLDPEAQQGLRPTRACAERYLWARDKRLSELLAGISNEWEMRHYEAAVKDNPQCIAEKKIGFLSAWTWEMKRYGNAAANLIPAESQEIRKAVAA